MMLVSWSCAFPRGSPSFAFSERFFFWPGMLTSEGDMLSPYFPFENEASVFCVKMVRLAVCFSFSNGAFASFFSRTLMVLSKTPNSLEI